MVDGNRCYSIMSDLEKRRWQKAVIKDNNNNQVLLNGKYWTFKEFIACSFFWLESKDGHDYWEWVSNKYIVHDLLQPQPRYINPPPKNEFKILLG